MAVITRANAEALLVRRVGKWLTYAGLDGTTVSGSNPDLNDPIGYALRAIGLSTASPVSVADSDVAGVGADTLDKFLDLAEYRTLLSILNNYDAVSLSVGGRSESYSDFVDRVKTAVDQKLAQLATDYGIGQGALTAGVIQLDFEQRSDINSTRILPS